MLIITVAFLSGMRNFYVRDWHWMIACSVYFVGMMTLIKELLLQEYQRLQLCHLLMSTTRMMSQKMILPSCLTGDFFTQIYFSRFSFLLFNFWVFYSFSVICIHKAHWHARYDGPVLIVCLFFAWIATQFNIERWQTTCKVSSKTWLLSVSMIFLGITIDFLYFFLWENTWGIIDVDLNWKYNITL